MVLTTFVGQVGICNRERRRWRRKRGRGGKRGKEKISGTEQTGKRSMITLMLNKATGTPPPNGGLSSVTSVESFTSVSADYPGGAVQP